MTKFMFAAALAIGLLNAAAAVANPQVSNIAGVYMANAGNKCPSLTTGHFCTITFPAVPSGKSLVVTKVSCLVATIGPAIPFVLLLQGAQEVFLANGTGVFFDGTAYYELVFSVLSVSASGSQPEVLITPLATSANLTAACTIAGNLKP